MTPRYGFESLFPLEKIVELETGRVVGIITAIHTSAEFRKNAQGENKVWAADATVDFVLTGDSRVLKPRELPSPDALEIDAEEVLELETGHGN